ncbi:MAG: preprotein translocase subunit SecG [Clostridia bacterium]|nr:preprotein translocase subunit SecG [Clostridia bacterium]
MEPIVIALSIVVLLLALGLALLVLMQSGKDNKLSGAIAGGMETFLGKSKSSTMDRNLSIATIIVSTLFVIAVLVLYMVA